MNLAQLAYACHIFDVAAAFGTDYNSSYASLVKTTEGGPDLHRPEHRQALLVWLNQWGCRQFRPSQYAETSARLAQWYDKCEHLLPPIDRHLCDSSRQEPGALGRAYGELKETTASNKEVGGKSQGVTVGPTGAAKVLFALRPHAAIPWDTAMRKAFKYSGSAKSYLRYLELIRSNLEGLRPECHAKGFALDDLPAHIGQHGSTLTKLIDEYHWVTITRRYPMPEEPHLSAWAELLLG